MENTESSLAVRDMVKTYGLVRAVDGVSFEVARGEIFGLLGPNGAGKTTLIECALGLRAADSGSVCVGGVDARTHPDEVKRGIGALLQSTALQDAITAREALDLFAAFYERAIPADRLLERFALTEKADARFETLSGGQRQRLGLALAFVNDPVLLFLDEPTSGLDPQARRALHEDIRQFRAEGRSVLLTTHYIEEAESLCDRIALLHQGRIAALGSPEELIARSSGRTRLIVRAARSLDPAALGRLAGIVNAVMGNGSVTLETHEPGAAIVELVRHLGETGNELVDLRVRKPSLEDVFLELTGEAGTVS